VEFSSNLTYYADSSTNTVSFGSGTAGGNNFTGYYIQPAPPDPEPQSPLDWLDGEIERTCKLARVPR
jgi:hypothetical protein